MTRTATFEDRATAEASIWLARLQRPDVSESDGLEFDAWLSAAPANRAAYQSVLSFWHEFEACPDGILAEIEAAARRPVRRPAPLRRWMAGLGGLALAAGLAVALLPPVLMQATVKTYVTGKGQHQRIALADGSTIDLNAESRLTVRLSRAERRVVLADGEAIFEVAHDESRPFVVEAANRLVRDIGTQFDVRSRRGELVVTVAEGKVQVSPLSPAAGRVYLLAAGERLSVADTGVEQLKAVDPRETFSWRAGRLVYRDQPLADVVADLNRQFVEQIEISDPDLAKTPITGVVVLDDPHSVVARLSLMLPIRSVPSERGLLLLRK
ncbi:MAG TPA: FecR domain-containing protein [Phenylobacterium sp.]|nr:FecR domain-containing protein [Phenylobacterium sp.]